MDGYRRFNFIIPMTEEQARQAHEALTFLTEYGQWERQKEPSDIGDLFPGDLPDSETRDQAYAMYLTIGKAAGTFAYLEDELLPFRFGLYVSDGTVTREPGLQVSVGTGFGSKPAAVGVIRACQEHFGAPPTGFVHHDYDSGRAGSGAVFVDDNGNIQYYDLHDWVDERESEARQRTGRERVLTVRPAQRHVHILLSEAQIGDVVQALDIIRQKGAAWSDAWEATGPLDFESAFPSADPPSDSVRTLAPVLLKALAQTVEEIDGPSLFGDIEEGYAMPPSDYVEAKASRTPSRQPALHLYSLEQDDPVSLPHAIAACRALEYAIDQFYGLSAALAAARAPEPM